jgi:hypothetical protein
MLRLRCNCFLQELNRFKTKLKEQFGISCADLSKFIFESVILKHLRHAILFDYDGGAAAMLSFFDSIDDTQIRRTYDIDIKTYDHYANERRLKVSLACFFDETISILPQVHDDANNIFAHFEPRTVVWCESKLKSTLSSGILGVVIRTKVCRCT